MLRRYKKISWSLLALVAVVSALVAPRSAEGLPNPLTWQLVGWCGGGAYPMIVSDPQNEGRLYLVSDVTGVLRSDNRGDHWSFRTEGLENVGGVCVAIAPSNPNVIYAAMNSALHRSDNAGASWQVLTASQNVIEQMRPGNYRALAVDPLNSSRVYAGTPQGKIYTSQDAGVTWSQAGNQAEPFGTALSISVLHVTSDGQYLLAGASAGLRRMNRQTGEWTNPGITGKVYDIDSPGPADPIFIGNDKKVSWSSDNGATWQHSVDVPFGSGEVYRLSTAKDTNNNMKILVGWRQNWNGGAYLSQNGGQSWTNVEHNLTYDTEANPTRVWSRGFGWPLSVEFDRFDPDVMYFTDFWGIWRSSDNGVSWQEKIRGAPNTVGSDVQFGRNGHLFIGSMDNGLMKSTDGGLTYTNLIPGSGSDRSMDGHVWRVIVQGANANRVIATNSPWDGVANQILVSENGGASFTKTRSGLPTTWPRVNTTWDKGYARSIAEDPTNPSRLYLGIDGTDGGGFFYSNDGGYNWARSSGQPADVRIYNGLVVDPTNSDRIFWGTTGGNGGVYRTEDRGQSWTKVFSGTWWCFDLAIDANGVVYAGTDTGGPAVYVSRNNGDSWSLLKKFTGTGTAEAIAIDKTNPQRIAVSTVRWGGYIPCKIYLTENGGATWTEITADLPSGQGAGAMNFNNEGTHLYLSRYSGSVYRLDLREEQGSDNIPPTAPGSVSGSVDAQGRVNLSWQASTDNVGVAGYRVSRNNTQVGQTTQTNFQDPTAPAGATHDYDVKAFDAANNISQSGSATVQVPDITAPTAPALSVPTIVNNEDVSLAWSQSIDNVGVTGYKVYRNSTEIATRQTTTYVDTTTVQGSSYAYFIRAFDAANNLSAESDTRNVAVPDGTAPSAPVGVSAQGRPNEILIAWTPNTEPDVIDYWIYRNAAKLQKIPAVTTLYSDMDVAGGISYAYNVTAVDATTNESQLSATVHATATDSGAPAIPSGLSAQGESSRVYLSWAANTEPDLAGYFVYRSLSSGGSYTRLNPSPQTQRTYADTAVQNGTSYWYRISSIDVATNESAQSPAVSATPADYPRQGLVAYWNMDEGTGQFAFDQSGYQNRAVLRNGAQWVPGKVGNAARLRSDFQQDFYVPDSPSLSFSGNQITLAAWIFPESGSRPAGLFHKDGHYGLIRSENNQLSYADSSDWKFSETYGSVPLNTWTHVAVTCNGSTMRFYVNGALVGSAPRSGNFQDNSNPLILGGLGADYFNGRMDELFIYNRGLATEEVLQLSRAGSIPPPLAPSGLAVVAGNERLTLNWNANTENHLAGYHVYRSESQGGAYARQNQSMLQVTTFSQTGLSGGLPYWYRVTAVDSGGRESNPSAAVAGTPNDTQPPTVPSGLAAVGNDQRVDLSWNANAEADLAGYNIYKSTSAGGTYVRQNQSPQTQRTYSDTEVQNGTPYWYRVSAVDRSANASAQTAFVTATPMPPPAPPSGLVITAGNEQLTLNWNANTENNFSGYHVYRSDTQAGTYVRQTANLLTVRTFTQTSLTGGATYWYKLTALDNMGRESGQSSAVGGTPIDSIPPAVPTAFSAIGYDARVDLSWNANTEPDLAGYNIYKSTSSGGTYTKLNSTLITQRTFTDTAVQNQTAYWYRVTAADASANESARSAAVTATPSLPPSVPTGLAVVPGNEQLSLSWNANAGNNLVGYNIYRSATQGGSATRQNQSVWTSTAYTQTGLIGGATYWYKLTAVDNVGRESAQSAGRSGVPIDSQPPALPSGFQAAGENGRVYLSWAANTEPDLAGYFVYRSLSSGGSYTRLNPSPQTQRTYADTAVQNGTSYWYRISSIDVATNESAQSPAVSATPADYPRQGLVAYWNMDEGTGQFAFDQSGYQNRAVLRNGAQWVPGKVGSAVQLVAASQQDLFVPDSASLSISGNQITLAAWIFPRSGSRLAGLFHKDSHYGLLRTENNRFSYADSLDWKFLEGYGAVPVNTWTHVAVLYNGNAMQFYVNGVLVGTSARSGSLQDNNSPLILGSQGADYFDGSMDELFIYNRALSAEEIRQLASH